MDERLVPEINIGLVGHVDHGKTTLVESLTGKWTDTHSEEKKRGITIRLGYADATFYKCANCEGTKSLGTTPKCVYCFGDAEPIRTVSFVDAPGHGTLMATVLSGAAIMDGALLMVSADEECPQPQTAEHLMALDIVGIRNIIIVQNKIDMVSKEQAMRNYQQIKDFVKGTVAENAPIVPISALQRVNIDALIETIQEMIPKSERDPKADPRMYIARSFDSNKPGMEIENIHGGVVGGSIVQGTLKIGDEIEIRPGIEIKGKWTPVKTKVLGLQKVGKNLEEAGPGGLLGLATELDPYVTKGDRLAGNLLGEVGKLPEIRDTITIDVQLMEKFVDTGEKIDPINTGEAVVMTSGVAKTAGVVLSSRNAGKEAEIKLKIPLCVDKGDRISLSRRVVNRWRLVGSGIVK